MLTQSANQKNGSAHQRGPFPATASAFSYTADAQNNVKSDGTFTGTVTPDFAASSPYTGVFVAPNAEAFSMGLGTDTINIRINAPQ